MEISFNIGDKFSAEVEKRKENGHLGMERLNFMVIKNSSGKLIAITDEFKKEDKDVIFRSYNFYELKNIHLITDFVVKTE